MLTSTLIHPQALKLLLPKSNNQTAAKPIVNVSVTYDLKYYIDDKPVSFQDLESELLRKVGSFDEPTVSLHADRRIALHEVVKVMNIAKNNNFKLILATSPE
jgi:biopolymer transport protein ExbD